MSLLLSSKVGLREESEVRELERNAALQVARCRSRIVDAMPPAASQVVGEMERVKVNGEVQLLLSTV